MTNTPTQDIAATVSQIKRLQEAGCEIVRVAVPDQEAAAAIAAIKAQIDIPLIADIHFNYRLAIAAAKSGADGLRLNPGNIGGMQKVKAVVECAKDLDIPIRIGVNSGSLEKDIIKKYNGVTPAGMVESGLRHVDLLKSLDVSPGKNIAQSLRCSAHRRGLPAAVRQNRSAAACRRNRSRSALSGNRQIGARNWNAIGRRHWRYHQGLFEPRPG